MYLIGLRPKPGPRYYELSESLHITLSTLAEHEGRPEDELIPDLLAAGLTQHHSESKTWQQWLSLAYLQANAGDTTAALAALDSAWARAESRAGRGQVDSLRSVFGGDGPQEPDSVDLPRR